MFWQYWGLFAAPVIFGCLVGYLGVLLFSLYFVNSPKPNKIWAFLSWLLGNGVVNGGVVFVEHIWHSTQMQDSTKLFTFFTSYLGGVGIGGFISMLFPLKNRDDQAFMAILQPLRKNLTHNQLTALFLVFCDGKEVEVAAQSMGITRERFEELLVSALREMGKFFPP